LFKLDEVVAQRRAFLRAYDAALVHPAPHELLRGLIPATAAAELASRPLIRRAWGHGWMTSRPVTASHAGAPAGSDSGSRDPLRRDRGTAPAGGGRVGSVGPGRALGGALRTATEQAAHVDALGEVSSRRPPCSPSSRAWDPWRVRRTELRGLQPDRAARRWRICHAALPYERPLPPDARPCSDPRNCPNMSAAKPGTIEGLEFPRGRSAARIGLKVKGRNAARSRSRRPAFDHRHFTSGRAACAV
jgi:hypothetical protein